MKSITIFGRTYEVPEVRDERFAELQERIHRQRELLARQERPRGLLGLFRPRPISDEERLAEMESLVDSYDRVVHELDRKIQACRGFFRRIAGGIQDLFGGKIEEIQELEARRRAALARARQAGNAGLEAGLAGEARRLQGLALTLTRACLLMLRKIEHSWQALQLLARDEAVQREVLDRLTEQLSLFREVHAYRRDAERLAREVEEITRLALDFESILRDSMGPFQTLIEEIGRVDDRIGESLADIERLSFELEQNRPDSAFTLEAPDERLLDYLVHVRLKQEAIGELLERLSDPDLGRDEPALPPGEPEVETTLENVRDLLSARLAGLSGNPPFPPAPPPPSVGHALPPLGEVGRHRRAGPAASAPRELWRQALPGPACAAPGLSEYGLIVGSGGGALACLDFDTGRPRWETRLEEDVLTAPAADGAAVWVGLRSGALHCLEAQTGRPVWRFASGKRIQAEPLRLEDRLIVASLDGNLYGLDPETGVELWKCRTGPGVSLRPAAAEGRLFAAANDGCLYAVDARTGSVDFVVRTGTRITGAPSAAWKDAVVWGGGDGRVLWTLETGAGRLDSPLVLPDRGLVACGTYGALFLLVNAAGGAGGAPARGQGKDRHERQDGHAVRIPPAGRRGGLAGRHGGRTALGPRGDGRPGVRRRPAR